MALLKIKMYCRYLGNVQFFYGAMKSLLYLWNHIPCGLLPLQLYHGGRMKKHQFVKTDCNCRHRETVFKCKYCGEMEYASSEELRHLEELRAACTGGNAPEANPMEVITGRAGNGFDCLSPEYE